jgi:4-hydroxymandelate oxidase
MDFTNLFEFEKHACEKLHKIAFDYYSSGAHDEITLRDNREAYNRIKIHYKVLVDVSKRDLSTEVLGQKISFPLIIAPTAFHKMAHDEGECAVAKAAVKADTIMCLSTLSNSTVEEVSNNCNSNFWFQLYVFRDKAVTEKLVRRVEKAGARAIVVTVDAPLLGTREKDVKNKFQLPRGLSVINLMPDNKDELPGDKPDSGLSLYFNEMLDQGLNWKDIEWLVSITKLPIILKGIVRPDDALRAIEYGAKGIVVSNHGGRQLDTSPATIEVLPSIAKAVDNRIEILVDGGVRRGTDIFKAVALGAKAVLVGRPVLWGLACNGSEGVFEVLSMLKKEFDLALALSGCPNVKDIQRDLVSFAS